MKVQTGYVWEYEGEMDQNYKACGNGFAKAKEYGENVGHYVGTWLDYERDGQGKWR